MGVPPRSDQGPYMFGTVWCQSQRSKCESDQVEFRGPMFNVFSLASSEETVARRHNMTSRHPDVGAESVESVLQTRRSRVSHDRRKVVSQTHSRLRRWLRSGLGLDSRSCTQVQPYRGPTRSNSSTAFGTRMQEMIFQKEASAKPKEDWESSRRLLNLTPSPL